MTATESLIATGEKIRLRDAIPGDEHAYLSWKRSGIWRSFDAPWENPGLDESGPRLRQRFRELFLDLPSWPRQRAILEVSGTGPIGWVRDRKSVV